MKNFKSLVVLLFLAFTTVASAQSKKSEKAVIKTNIICDHCKVCETCGQMFQTEMLKIKGVKMYELNEEKETITVYFNPKKTNLQDIKTAISKLGFDADEIKADPIAYENLDGCCKA